MADHLYYFNPTCELAVANGSFSYMPPRLLRQFEEDCSTLPFVFGTPSDFVLTEKKPSTDFIHQMINAGFEMPQFMGLNELSKIAKGSLSDILPWGWSPAAHFKLKELKEKCALTFQKSPVFNWKEKNVSLYERITSLNFLRKFLEENHFDFLIETILTGSKVTSIEEIEILVKQNSPLVLKAPLSSSGRGIQVVRKPILNNSNRQWISGVLNQQSYLVAEPFLDKLIDLSFQFKINDSGQPEYLGYSVFKTNTNGQYQSSLIHPENEKSGISEILENTSYMIETTAEKLRGALKNSIYTTMHRGFLGIDAMIYKDENELKMQPCIEINSRMNMGILTKQIEKIVDAESSGKYELFYGHRGEFQQFVNTNTLNHPLKMNNGKLSSGFLALIEPDEEKQFGAYLLLR